MRVQAACWHELQRGGDLQTTKWVICSLIYSQYDSVRTKNKNAHSHPLAGRHIETLHWNRSWRHIIRTIRRSLRDNGTIGVFLRPHNNTYNRTWKGAWLWSVRAARMRSHSYLLGISSQQPFYLSNPILIYPVYKHTPLSSDPTHHSNCTINVLFHVHTAMITQSQPHPHTRATPHLC